MQWSRYHHPFFRGGRWGLEKSTNLSQDAVPSLVAAPESNQVFRLWSQQHELCRARPGGFWGETRRSSWSHPSHFLPAPTHAGTHSYTPPQGTQFYIHTQTHTGPHMYTHTLTHRHAYICAHSLLHSYTATCIHTLMPSQPSNWLTHTHTHIYSNLIAMWTVNICLNHHKMGLKTRQYRW